MININLVPENLRKKKKTAMFAGLNIPAEVVVGSVGGLLVLLIGAHIALLVINSRSLSVHKQLAKEWEAILPSKENVDAVVSELRTLQIKLKDIEKITGEGEVSWSQKLNIISNNLPRGVWLTKITLTEEAFFIQGSAVSRQQGKMINVHNFAANLNRNRDFLDRLTGLELGSIQRRQIVNTEVADFLITMELR